MGIGGDRETLKRNARTPMAGMPADQPRDRDRRRADQDPGADMPTALAACHHGPMARYQFEPLDGHVAEAAAMFVARYELARRREPLLPAGWVDPSTIEALIRRTLPRGPSTAVVRRGRLVGYMASAEFESGTWRLALSREWGNGAAPGEARPVYEAMYADLARRWIADGYRRHDVCLLSDDDPALPTSLAWLGFGRVVLDGIRGLDAPADVPDDVAVRRAGVADVAAVRELHELLARHLHAPPIFQWRADVPDVADLERDLADPRVAYFLADGDGRNAGWGGGQGGGNGVRNGGGARRSGAIEAGIRIGPASQDASWVIRDAGTASITAAFTRPADRERGVARALLAAGLAWARNERYVRCAVDWETANLSGNRFWLEHFQPVVAGFSRLVDLPPEYEPDD
jgi:GNAT superfamily N-acetyltransferase